MQGNAKSTKPRKANQRSKSVKAVAPVVKRKAVTTSRKPARAKVKPPVPAERPITPFAVEVFPLAIRRFCKEVAEATATPPDFAGLAILVTAGVAIGNSHALQLKTGWEESPRFYAAAIAPPSSGKTPAFETVLESFRELDQEKVAEYRATLDAYENRLSERKVALETNRRLKLADCLPVPVALVKPVEPQRTVVADITLPSIVEKIDANRRGILVAADELLAWTRGMGQNKIGRGNDRQFWLSAWSGTPHCVDRKGRPPIAIPKPFVSVLGGIQPDMLKELLDAGGRSDGFIDRLLFVYPQSSLVRTWSDASVSEQANKAWARTIAGLRNLSLTMTGSKSPIPTAVELSTKAEKLWQVWYDAHNEQSKADDFDERLNGVWFKLPSHCARIALVLHLLGVYGKKIDERGQAAESTIEGAIKLAEYFKDHARRVFAEFGQTKVAVQERSVLKWVKATKAFTAREMQRTGVAGIKSANVVDRGLKESQFRGLR